MTAHDGLAQIGPTLTAQSSGSFWMPPQGTEIAGDVDWVFYLILWIALFFFVLIVGLMLFFILRYRRRRGVAAEKTATHSMALELTWSIVPLLLVVVIFYVGFKTYLNLQVPPENAYEINVIGQRWQWIFEYANGYVDEDLHVPADENIVLLMRSEDVIHSFYIPDFRVKMDVLPGRYTKLWFRAREPGEHVVYCTEYCGTGHSDMLARVVVHPPGEFETWLENAANVVERMAPAEAGAWLYEKRGCAQCHGKGGAGGIGPPLRGIFGREQALAGGASVVVDENYIRESILNPQAKIVAGYEQVPMSSYQGRLSDKQVGALIEYIKSLK